MQFTEFIRPTRKPTVGDDMRLSRLIIVLCVHSDLCTDATLGHTANCADMLHRLQRCIRGTCEVHRCTWNTLSALLRSVDDNTRLKVL